MNSKSFNQLRLGSSSKKPASSKKGKKNKSEIKPKQPLRGLGVAQLEKIRLQSEMNEHANLLHSPLHNHINKEHATLGVALPSSSSRMLPPSVAFCQRFLGGNERSELFGQNEYKPRSTPKNRNVYLAPTDAPTCSTIMLPRFEHTIEDSVQKKRRHDLSISVSSKSQCSESSSHEEELDLELKLSI